MDVGVFFIVILFTLFARLLNDDFDEDRIKTYIEGQGGELLSKEWRPLGKEWFGEKKNRIYKIIYLDKFGHKHEAFVKTSSFSGVYFTEDTIIAYNNASNQRHLENRKSNHQKLIAENEHLKREIEWLKNRR